MAQLTVTLPQTTLSALKTFAEMTGRSSDLGMVIQDSLRTYEWIMRQQAKGHFLVALKSDDLQKLSENLGDSPRQYLSSLIEGREDDARRYFDFDKAA